MCTYNRGDYVKVEIPDEATGVGEWVWMRVNNCDDEEQVVYGSLDNQPLHDYAGHARNGIGAGSELFPCSGAP